MAHVLHRPFFVPKYFFFVVFFYIRKITSETGNISRPWFFVCLYIHMPGSNLTMYNTAHTDNIFVFFCYPWSIRGKKKKKTRQAFGLGQVLSFGEGKRNHKNLPSFDPLLPFGFTCNFTFLPKRIALHTSAGRHLAN